MSDLIKTQQRPDLGLVAKLWKQGKNSWDISRILKTTEPRALMLISWARQQGLL